MKTRVSAPVGGMLAVAIALAACGGGGGSHPAPLTPAATTAPGTTPGLGAQTVSYGAAALQGAQYVAQAQFGTMGVDVYTAMPGSTALGAYAAQLNDPHSPIYRRFLTPQQLGDQFGTPKAEYDAAVTYFRGKGLGTATWPQRQMIHVNGSQANLEQAFGTRFGVYTKNGQQFVAPMVAPRFATHLAIAAVGGLVHVATSHSFFGGVAPRATSGILEGLTPFQIAQAYDFTSAYRAGFTGSGITIGTLGWGTMNPSDVAEFGKLTNWPVASVANDVSTDQNVSPGNPSCSQCQYSQGLSTPPPLTPPGCNTALPFAQCNPEDGESQLDLEQIASLAYGANVLFYIAYNPSECFAPGNFTLQVSCPGSAPPQPIEALGAGYLSDDEFQQAIGDNRADILNFSGGICEQANLGYGIQADGTGFQHTEFASLAALGIAVFASSGDDGATACRFPFPTDNELAVNYPASDPFVTAVGGVNTPVDNTGKLVAPITAWGFQTTLGNPGSNAAGTGGGVSAVFPKPAYQTGTNLDALAKRAIPDISYNADPRSGVPLLMNSGTALGGRQLFVSGGTSESAPQAAAAWALVLQACAQNASCAKAGGAKPYRLGNPNPLFYAIYNAPASAALQYGNVFYDVTYGNNGAAAVASTPNPSPTPAAGYNAGLGYDQVTGLGVPFVRNLIRSVTGI